MGGKLWDMGSRPGWPRAGVWAPGGRTHLKQLGKAECGKKDLSIFLRI